MSFFGGLFGGSNPILNQGINEAGSISGFGTGVGEGAVSTGLGFEEGILSGNQAEQAKLLAPEINTIAQQGQQANQTAAEFGNRSGGTNAAAQQNMDKQRSAVNDMISKLTGQAAGAVTQTGENLLNTGLTANDLAAYESQQRMDNWNNSILGRLVNGAADTGMMAAGMAV